MLPSRECGFVNFIELDDAIIAREKMNGAKLGNVVIKVGYGKIDVGSDQNQPTKSLWVGNILPSTKPSDLEQVFGRYGKVESARVLTHKNCGFVNFYSAHDAIIARDELNGRDLAGAIVKIGFAKVPKAEMMTKEQALANPGIIAGLAGAAMDKIMPWASADNAPDSPSMFFSNGKR